MDSGEETEVAGMDYKMEWKRGKRGEEERETDSDSGDKREEVVANWIIVLISD